MSPVKLIASFETTESFLDVVAKEINAGGLLIRGATLPPGASRGDCIVAVQVSGGVAVEVAAQIAATIPGVGVAVMFPTRPSALHELAESLRAGEAPADDDSAVLSSEEDESREETTDGPAGPAGPLVMRLRTMSVNEKMQLGLSGDREARTFLLRDTNKTIHLYVLRNPRIGLDEVVAAARQPSLAPDALKFIADHKEWGLNPSICTGLARNPRAPIPLVLKVLPRVPQQEIRVIAKGNGRAPIVQAARKLVNG